MPMSFAHKSAQVFPFPNSTKLPLRAPKPFDETLIRRLNALAASLSPAAATVPLSFVSDAVDLLSSTLTSFARFLSDPSLSRSDADVAALSSHLDASAALLDAANSLHAAADRLSFLRLHLILALRLLARRAPSPDLARKVRASLAEWRLESSSPLRAAAGGLIRCHAPRGKSSAVHRAIYAVEAVSALAVAIVSSFLGGAKSADLDGIHVSGEVSWAEAFNAVLTAVKAKRGSFAAEIEAVDVSVKKLTASIDDVGVTSRDLTDEAEKLTEELTAGLDRLGGALNGMFRAGLRARDAALQGFRIGPKNCK